MVGKVEEYLLRKIQDEGAIHITLIDPEKVTVESVATISSESESCGSSAIMVGGTTLVSPDLLNDITRTIKRSVKIPVILFPNNVTGISEYADAIWFMSLLNSADPYFISGAQVLAAPLIKKLGLEAIPLGYIIVGEGGSAGVIGKACPIPYNKPELAVAHALAAQFFGMRFVYLEAGSGASRPVPAEMIEMVRRNVDLTLIVGGGIRTREHAKVAAKAGANIVVTGTVTEIGGIEEVKRRLIEIIEGVREGAKDRIRGIHES
ncbi:MAG: geranylgeranylglyceryl/heptaprenylglyceryl phosphate synthase [Candidatus Bathyarchaeia archaeon]|nr:geranylgeranylglyceryl/heptaprenylglyceryl phosphate synthase [Candidatus Bathyarchaeota archaeon]